MRASGSLPFQLKFPLSAHSFLRAAVFLDAAGMRLVGDPDCLGGGDQREVKWTGGRLHFAACCLGSWMS